MGKRFVVIWFYHLGTDWLTLRQPRLKNIPFVLSESSHGKMMITAVNEIAHAKGVEPGMAVADARAIVPSLEAFENKQGVTTNLLTRIADWCIRYSPFVAMDGTDGLL